VTATVADLFPEAEVTLREQVQEVAREIEQRKRAYPRFVASGTLPETRATRQMRRMVAESENAIKEARKPAPDDTQPAAQEQGDAPRQEDPDQSALEDGTDRHD
jgi:hypothetical protein